MFPIYRHVLKHRSSMAESHSTSLLQIVQTSRDLSAAQCELLHFVLETRLKTSGASASAMKQALLVALCPTFGPSWQFGPVGSACWQAYWSFKLWKRTSFVKPALQTGFLNARTSNALEKVRWNFVISLDTLLVLMKAQGFDPSIWMPCIAMLYCMGHQVESDMRTCLQGALRGLSSLALWWSLSHTISHCSLHVGRGEAKGYIYIWKAIECRHRKSRMSFNILLEWQLDNCIFKMEASWVDLWWSCA